MSHRYATHKSTAAARTQTLARRARRAEKYRPAASLDSVPRNTRRAA